MNLCTLDTRYSLTPILILPVNQTDKEIVSQSLNIYVRSSASLLVNESASQFITSSPDHLYVPQPYQFVHLHPSRMKTLDHQLSTEGCDRSHRQSANRNKTRKIWATARWCYCTGVETVTTTLTFCTEWCGFNSWLDIGRGLNQFVLDPASRSFPTYVPVFST